MSFCVCVCDCALQVHVLQFTILYCVPEIVVKTLYMQTCQKHYLNMSVFRWCRNNFFMPVLNDQDTKLELILRNLQKLWSFNLWCIISFHYWTALLIFSEFHSWIFESFVLYQTIPLSFICVKALLEATTLLFYLLHAKLQLMLIILHVIIIIKTNKNKIMYFALFIFVSWKKESKHTSSCCWDCCLICEYM